MKKHRMTLEFSEEPFRVLEELKEKTEAASAAEVIRRAIHLHFVLASFVSDGSELYLLDEDGSRRELVLLHSTRSTS